MIDQRGLHPGGDGAVVHKIPDFVHRIIDGLPALLAADFALSAVEFSAYAEALIIAEPRKRARSVLPLLSLVIVVPRYI